MKNIFTEINERIKSLGSVKENRQELIVAGFQTESNWYYARSNGFEILIIKGWVSPGDEPDRNITYQYSTGLAPNPANKFIYNGSETKAEVMDEKTFTNEIIEILEEMKEYK